MAFKALQLTQKRHKPSCFLTNNTGDENGLVLGRIMPLLSKTDLSFYFLHLIIRVPVGSNVDGFRIGYQVYDMVGGAGWWKGRWCVEQGCELGEEIGDFWVVNSLASVPNRYK